MIEKNIQAQRLGKLIFLTFTRELIRNEKSFGLFRLGKILEEGKIRNIELRGSAKEEIKEKVHEIVQAKEEELEELVKNERFVKTKEEEDYFPVPTSRKLTFKAHAKNIQAVQQVRQVQRMRLIIPEIRLPERFNYLKPIPFEAHISLGKLDQLIKDSEVKMIECNGHEENIIVKGEMGERKTPITLTKAEIDEIINIFSMKTKIPAHEGIYKVVFGKLVFMAIVSEAIGSKFIIKKLEQQRNPRPY